MIKTKFSQLLWEGKEEQLKADLKVNRLGQPADVAMAVAFLASEDASYVNGETLVVAGRPSSRL